MLKRASILFRQILTALHLVRPKRVFARRTAHIAAPKVSGPATEIVNMAQKLGIETLHLVGENWLHGADKPIAVLYEFSLWKREIVAQYLSEYRCAYVRGRTRWSKVKRALDRLETFTLIVWGMKEPPKVLAYAERRKIPMSRMEDGFLRSAELGSTHSLPLSLVLDEQGIYFDATKPSELERLLNKHDFAQTQDMLSAARPLMRIMRELGISKYSLGSLQRVEHVLGPRIKKRVLVLGQVENDASVRFGLAEGWTNLRLIQLAVEENSDAEILYRPHPDVAQGSRASCHSIEELATLCRVLTEDLAMSDLFGEVDHAYTITSLSGFEALVHGLRVTTVGAPFYSGWGLTDDRTSIPRRQRKLTLDELFCAAYLLYPRYIADRADPVRGALATLFRLAAERRACLDKKVTLDLAQTHPHMLCISEYWPAALRKDIFAVLNAKFKEECNMHLAPQRIFSGCKGDYFQRSMSYLIAGAVRESSAFARFLGDIRACVRKEHFAALLTDLWAVKPSAILLDYWTRYCEEIGQIAEADLALNHLAYKNSYCPVSDTKLPISAQQYPSVLKLAEFSLRHGRLDESYTLFNRLLISGHIAGEIVAGVAEIARLRLDFESAAALLRFLNRYQPSWKQGQAFFLEAQAAALAGQTMKMFDAACSACAANPHKVIAVGGLVDALDRSLCDLPYADAWLAANEVNKIATPIASAKALIAANRPVDAEEPLGQQWRVGTGIQLLGNRCG